MGDDYMGQLERKHRFDTTQMPATAKREEASPIKRVRDRETHEIVGYLYEWNTGHRNVMWTDVPHSDVIYD